jgi:hypothetical protein
MKSVSRYSNYCYLSESRFHCSLGAKNLEVNQIQFWAFI